MTPENPFRVTGLAEGEQFFNRTQELDFLIKNAKGGQHTLLLAPRRYGKSSLLRQVSQVTENNIQIISVDLFKCSSLHDLIHAICTQIIRSQSTTASKLFGLIKKGIPKIAPKISIGASGEAEFKNEKIPFRCVDPRTDTSQPRPSLLCSAAGLLRLDSVDEQCREWNILHRELCRASRSPL